MSDLICSPSTIRVEEPTKPAINNLASPITCNSTRRFTIRPGIGSRRERLVGHGGREPLLSPIIRILHRHLTRAVLASSILKSSIILVSMVWQFGVAKMPMQDSRTPTNSGPLPTRIGWQQP